MDTPVQINADTKSSNRLNSLIAISVALLAGFMAVTKVKDDNIVQAMLQGRNPVGVGIYRGRGPRVAEYGTLGCETQSRWDCTIVQAPDTSLQDSRICAN